MTPNTTVAERIRGTLPDRRGLAAAAFVLNAEFVAVILYYVFLDVTLTQPRYLVYGLAWVNIAGLVFLWVRPADRPDFYTRRRALGVATAYFGVLAVVGGLVGTGLGEAATGLRIAWLTPGWGPAVVYGGESVSFVLMPAYVFGYLALAYLVYITILEASRTVIGSLLGLLSCVSCTWPLLMGVASSIVGGTGFLAASALQVSYDLSTLVFVMTVAILVWRPGFD